MTFVKFEIGDTVGSDDRINKKDDAFVTIGTNDIDNVMIGPEIFLYADAFAKGIHILPSLYSDLNDVNVFRKRCLLTEKISKYKVNEILELYNSMKLL